MVTSKSAIHGRYSWPCLVCILCAQAQKHPQERGKRKEKEERERGKRMCYPGSNQEKVNKNCPSVRRGKLETMNTIREEIRANLCWLSLVIGQRSVVLCFTVTGCETIEATADTGRMLLPLPSNEKKSWQASKM